MKKVRMIVSTAVVIAVVGSALAFKPYNQGTIYCIANSSVSSVNQNLACTAASQPASTKIDFELSSSGADPTSNPCLSNQPPFDGRFVDACVQTTPGVYHYRTTAL